MRSLGVDLGGTNIKVGLVDQFDGVLEQTTLKTEANKGPDHIIDQLLRGCDRVSEGYDAGTIHGIGIGSPGTVNLARTTIAHPPNMPGWKVVNVAEAVQQRRGSELRVVVENDANAAGLGSAFFGAGRPFDSFLMVTIGTGVGGAIIHEKRLFRGVSGAAGEFGHVSIDYEGPPSRAGTTGAIEAYIGKEFLSEYARYRLLNRPDTAVHEMTGPDLEELDSEILYRAALDGDKPAQEVLAWAGHKLGRMLGSLVNVLDIRKVVVGGGVSAAGAYILDPARESLWDGAMPAFRAGLELVQETLGNEVGILGAAHLIFERIEDEKQG
ncbi:MAG: ROK family protein [Bacteroidota bacterium]